MKTIWKFELNLEAFDGSHCVDRFDMPRGARVLSAQEQNGSVCLWAVVETDAPKVERIFHMATTGNPAPERAFELEFIDTVQLVGMIATLVLHVFELPEHLRGT